MIGDDLLDLGRRVAVAVDKAGRALTEADVQLAQEVIDGDHAIDDIEERIETACVSVLALQQPVATDLRMVVSAMRISATLERMGDLARHVAFAARSAYPTPASSGEMMETLAAMAEAARHLTSLLVTVMEEHDLQLVAEINEKDDRLDALLRRSFELLTQQKVELTRQEVIDAVLLSRFLERLGDHCVAASRRIAYLVTGDLDASLSVPDPEIEDD